MAKRENNGQNNDAPAANPTPQAPVASSGVRNSAFNNDLQAQRDALSRECAAIATWIEQQTGIKPSEVRHSPPWQGEDRQIGVQVFFARGREDSDTQPFGKTDWWIVKEKSGERHLYPCMLSTAADAVKYHHQVRNVQLKPGK